MASTRTRSKKFCLVCSDAVKPEGGGGTGNKKIKTNDLLEKELLVYFFANKFIAAVDILKIFSTADEDNSGEYLEKFLKLSGGKTLGESVTFCNSCDQYVRQARELHKEFFKLLAELDDLQRALRRKLNVSFQQEEGLKEKSRSGRSSTSLSLRDVIRRNLKERLHDTESTNTNASAIIDVGVEMNLDAVKAESSLEEEVPLHSASVKTEAEDDNYLSDEDFGMLDASGGEDVTNDDNDIDLKEFVICPSELQEAGDKLESETNSKPTRSSTSGKRKSRKRKGPRLTHKKTRTRKSDEQKSRTVSIEDRTCPVCKNVFLRRSRMKWHLNAVHEKLIKFKCEIEECGKEYYFKSCYTNHMKKHLSKEQIMHLILADKFNLVKLIEGTPFNLEEIMNEIERRESREYSQEIVDQVLNRTCPKCCKIYETPPAMQYHLKMHHKHTDIPPELRSRFVCEKCGKSYALLAGYKEHIRFDHAEEEPTLPSENPANGEVSKRLGRKKTIHGPPFFCDIEGCNRSFTRPGYVRGHKKNFHRMGKDTGPHLCSFCGKELRNVGSLRRHIFTHHTENAPRNYKCHLCDKAFLTSDKLKKHLKCKYHGGPGNPWGKSKWNPKYNLSRKKKVNQSKKDNTSSVNSEEKSIAPVNQCNSSSEPNAWLPAQGEGIVANNKETVTVTDSVISKDIPCPAQYPLEIPCPIQPTMFT